MRRGQRFSRLGQRVQVGRVDHQCPGGQRRRRPAGRRAGRRDGRGVYPGAGRGPAGAEQPGQHRLGDGVGARADEYAFTGRPRRGGDGQQARPGPFGRVDPAHAKGGKLAAQPRVGLAVQDQRYRHACPPSGTGRRDSRLALRNVAGGHACGREEHAGRQPQPAGQAVRRSTHHLSSAIPTTPPAKRPTRPNPMSQAPRPATDGRAGTPPRPYHCAPRSTTGSSRPTPHSLRSRHRVASYSN